MTNQFEEFFANDPQERAAIDAERTKVAEQEAAKNKERTIQEEIKKYDELVTSVLDELREAAYPAGEIAKGVCIDPGSGTRKLPHTAHWQVGYKETKMVSGKYRAYNIQDWKSTVSVGLVTDERGVATAFQCSNIRTEQCELTREALVQTLKEVHTPLPENTGLLSRYSEMSYVLYSIVNNPRYQDAFGSKDLFKKEEGDSRILKPLPGSKNGSMYHEMSVRARHQSSWDNEDYTIEVITIRLVVDKNQVPQYYIGKLKDLTANASLDPTFLAAMLDGLLQSYLDKQEAQRHEEARKQTLRYKLSQLAKRIRGK